MKKIIIVLFLLSILYYISNYKNEQYIRIPNNSIRFRIIANSDKREDQNIKLRIIEELEQEIFSKAPTNIIIENSKQYIKNNIPKISKIIEKYNTKYNINFGKNYFPEKEFNGVTYPKGTYDSLVITLGNGKGHNWWCILFPPLCTIEANQDNYEKYEYRTLIKEIIEKY